MVGFRAEGLVQWLKALGFSGLKGTRQPLQGEDFGLRALPMLRVQRLGGLGFGVRGASTPADFLTPHLEGVAFRIHETSTASREL